MEISEEQKKQIDELLERSSEIQMQEPWGNHVNGCSSNFVNALEFIEIRTKLHEKYIIESEKTKRLALLISFLMFITAVSVVIFAPPGREELSYWIGGSLLLFSAGAVGYKRLWAKTPLVSIEADNKI